MRSAEEENAINRVLKAWGMGSLDDPGTVQQLAYKVDDHAHFGKLLKACEPGLRREMYEAMAPNLRFQAKPLEAYIIEAKAYAAAAELPTIDEAGNLHQYHPPEVHTPPPKDAEIVDTIAHAIERLTAKGYLDVVCFKCTKTARFYALNKADGIWKARNEGWAYNEVTHAEICPECLNRGRS